MAEFRFGRTWRSVDASATVAPGDYRAVVKADATRRSVRRWRRKSAACRRSWRIKGVLYSNDGTCAAAPALHDYRGFSGDRRDRHRGVPQTHPAPLHPARTDPSVPQRDGRRHGLHAVAHQGWPAARSAARP
jgi:hypothetical protein